MRFCRELSKMTCPSIVLSKVEFVCAGAEQVRTVQDAAELIAKQIDSL